MDTNKRSVNQDYSSPTYQPRTYPDMDSWINTFSAQEWLALLGAYSAGGFGSVVKYMKTTYLINLDKWREKDLYHFFNSRSWGDFKTRFERRF